MALPLLAIAKILGQLTALVPAAEGLLLGLRRAVSKIPNNPATEHLDEIERSLKLQVEVSENLARQLQVIQAALGGIQKSLKILAYTVIGGAVLAVVAIGIALSK